MSFKDNLKSELEFRGILVKELAVNSGISRRTLDNYLRNNESQPTAENAVKIAQSLNVTVEYLVTGKNPSSQNSTPQLTDEEIRIYKQNAPLIKKLAQLSSASKKAIENLLEQMK